MKSTIIVDLDGTLADVEHRVHLVQNRPAKWNEFFEACDKDTPITPIIKIVNTFFNTGKYQIVILSGRMETVRVKTETWLKDNLISYHRLVMRKEGDFRPDKIVKKEMLLKAPNDKVKDDILFILDDRDSVVRMWRDMGYVCLQVAEGNF